jgi:hypothetical protein
METFELMPSMIECFRRISKMASVKTVQEDVANNSSDPYMRAPHKPEAYTEVEALRMLRCEKLRRETFGKWTSSAVPPKALARAGFIYNGTGDRTQCVFCLMQIEGWEDKDDPVSEHKRLAKNCPFVCGKPVGNIPIGQKDANWEVTPLTGFGYDETDIPGIQKVNQPEGEGIIPPKLINPVTRKYDIAYPKGPSRWNLNNLRLELDTAPKNTGMLEYALSQAKGRPLHPMLAHALSGNTLSSLAENINANPNKITIGGLTFQLP